MFVLFFCFFRDNLRYTFHAEVWNLVCGGAVLERKKMSDAAHKASTSHCFAPSLAILKQVLGFKKKSGLGCKELFWSLGASD